MITVGVGYQRTVEAVKPMRVEFNHGDLDLPRHGTVHELEGPR